MTPDLYVLAVAGGLSGAAARQRCERVRVRGGMVAGSRRGPAGGRWWRRSASATSRSGRSSTRGAVGVLAYALGFVARCSAASNLRSSVERAEQAELLLAQTQRSQEEELRAARLEESARIARDIHDVLAHTLAGLTIQLEATTRCSTQGADLADDSARVRRAHELAREGLSEARRAVGALRGDAPVSVREAIVALVAALRRGRSGGDPEIDGDPERLRGAAGQTVVRMTQEALTNVRKHAPGADVWSS